ncbi:MAG: DUF4291 domain-containing protein [Bacteroidia bacterium]|nr:DUF4291 domain-containing protein [Bacteroidia bacterium]
MEFRKIKYHDYLENVPKTGKHILIQENQDQLLFYQAYNHKIADWALEHQELGGNAFSYNRMSWIKPNFLWMMFRCGWAHKENQECVLGIWIKKHDFEHILQEAVYSSFQSDIYGSVDKWKTALALHEVRLQWDPDHDIYGNKVERRAIQLGLKGKILKAFGTEMIEKIVDMTPFVKEQKEIIKHKKLDELQIPDEGTFLSKNPIINQKLGLS